MSEHAQFKTQRTRLIEQYDKSGGQYLASTKPYKSKQTIVFNVVDPLPNPAATTGPLAAHAVARRGQQLTFFGYGKNDPIGDGFGRVYNAGPDDTNLLKAKSTNGSEDFVIEGISVTGMGVRVKWAVPATPPPIADPDVLAAYYGIQGTPGAAANPPGFADPGAIASPPQMDSPFLLENTLLRAVLPFTDIVFTWDDQRTEKVGTLDEMPEGGAKSFLKANGDPRNDNRYRIPEGYLWRREGQPDCNFTAVATLDKAIVIPITAVALYGVTPSQAAPSQVPIQIALDIVMRVHGLALRTPSNN